MTREQLLPLAYRYMYLSRCMDEKMRELFRKGHVKGTVIMCHGTEATAVGMAIPFRPAHDVFSILHRDLGAHLVSGADPFLLMCQHMANEKSPTHGREGNVHHGNALQRRFPMISHLGDMLALAVGGVWAARQNGEDVYGLAVIGDGGTSTGDFHESLNLASVRKSPVLFVVENNHYAYSTPTSFQYNCRQLSDRAAGYGIPGKTIDGTDVWEVYSAVCDALEIMSETSLPYLLECMTLRLEGHAVYDTAEYVPAKERESWLRREPLARSRKSILEENLLAESDLDQIESQTAEYINEITAKAVQYGRPSPLDPPWNVYSPRAPRTDLKPFKAANLRNLNAVNSALDYILAENSDAFICGQDVGNYGSAFKSCKGLFSKYGPDRVMDFPICESATVGFCLGASQTGKRPIMEFQFADFATEAVTQIGLNTGTWYFRSGSPASILFRFPCGGGITLGAFHSGEFDGLWSRFPGLKILYPATPQETFEAIVAGFYDPNPCLIFEHKLLYWGKPGDVDFDGDAARIWRPRKYTEGNDITIIAMGAMVEAALNAVKAGSYSAEVWNPFILNPLQFEPILESIRTTGRLLVVQESGETAGLGDRFISLAARACGPALKCAPVLISSPDTPVPFAKELEQHYLPNQDKILRAIETMIGESR